MEIQEQKDKKKSFAKIIFAVVGIIVLLFVIIFTLEFLRVKKQLSSGEISIAEDSIVPDGEQEITRKDIEDAFDPSIGPEDAKVVIVAFEDFECPFCARAFPIIREIMTIYKDQVRFIFRDFPLTQVHPNALPAALAAECAHEQGKFWPYHDKLFSNQTSLSATALKQYAKEINLNTKQFNNCVETGKYIAEVQNDFETGVDAGVTGTPTWFINGKKISGVIPLEAWKKIIEAELNK